MNKKLLIFIGLSAMVLLILFTANEISIAKSTVLQSDYQIFLPFITKPRSIILDQNGDVGKYTSIVIGVDGLPIISYFDSTNADLKVAHCEEDTCTKVTVTRVDSEGFVGEYTSIDDFKEVFDFREAFDESYRVTIDQRP